MTDSIAASMDKAVIFTKLKEFINMLTIEELRTLRNSLNGKISKRSITPDQQAKMQQARKKPSK